MSKNESPPLESYDSAIYADEPSPRVNLSTLPDGAMVLATAIENDRYRDGGCSVVCPGCADPVATYASGLSETLPLFEEQCDSCGVGLRRWSAVVVPSIQPPVLAEDELRNLVQAYWDDRFREGVQNLGLPHTREFGRECNRLAEQWNWDWSVTCPLCSRSLDELPGDYLGYHHWNYEEDCGTSLCHDCHDYVHGSKNNGHKKSTANIQDWRARELGLRDFRDLAVIRLAIRDRHLNDEERENYAAYLKQRYNVPLPVDRIHALITDVRHRDAVDNAIMEYGGSPTIDDHRTRAK